MLVTQSLTTEFDPKKALAKRERDETYKQKTAAFREGQYKLHPNDTLPRGRYFHGKKAGKPITIQDECHKYFERDEVPLLKRLW